ncbi:MAG: DNA adenine methylase [Moraxella sp.]|nr:DNA adenine methylase [Moraxella sp.]
MAFIKKSDKMQFFCTDFENIFLKIDKADMVYCDPPYLPLTDMANFTTYNKNGFDLDDHYRLARISNLYKEKSHKILISNHDTPLAHELYHGATIKHIAVQRNISAKSESRKKSWGNFSGLFINYH